MCLTLLGSSCGAAYFESTSAKYREVKRRPYAAGWEQILLPEMIPRLKAAELPELRSVSLPEGDVEIRVWVGFDLSETRVLILRQIGGNWTASYLIGLERDGFGSLKDDSVTTTEIPLEDPKMGWQSLWKRLDELDFLYLPDAEEIGMEHIYIHSTIVVVEMLQGDWFRTYYLFGLPVEKEQHHKAVRNMREICLLLSEQFDVLVYDYKGRILGDPSSN
jgi:hypothetical protein